MSEPDYRALFERVPGLLLLLSPDLTVVAVSDAYLAATATRREDLVGRPAADVLPDEMESARASLDRVRSELVPEVEPVQQHAVRRSAGPDDVPEERYWSAVNVPIRDHDGTLTYILRRVDDVTDYMHLQESGETYKRAADLFKAAAVRMEAQFVQSAHEVTETSRQLKEANAELRQTIDALERSRADLAVLAGTRRALLAGEDVAGAVCRAALQLMAARAAAVLVPDGTGNLALAATAGVAFPPMTLAVDAPYAVTKAFRTRERQVTQRGSGQDRSAELWASIDQALGTPLQSAIALPLVVEERCLGVLALGFDGQLDQEEPPLLELLAIDAALALERDALTRQLTRQALTDPLTELPNRRALEHALEQRMAERARSGAPLAVAMLDLDHFKQFNDEHGHPAGDDLLRAVAKTWTSRLRTSDTLARFGGEEFVVLLQGCTAPEAARRLEELRAATPEDTSVSIGVAELLPDETAAQLLARADAALYRAKAAGRDRVAIADQA